MINRVLCLTGTRPSHRLLIGLIPSSSALRLSSFRELSSVAILVDLARLRLPLRACPSLLHEPSILHIRRSRLPPRSVLPDVVVNPATPTLSAMYALRLGPRSLRLYAGFCALRAAYVPPSVRSSLRPEHLRVPTLSAPRSPSVGSSRVRLSFPECAVVEKTVPRRKPSITLSRCYARAWRKAG